jgi:tripartite ATP-independent transporter DctM subunit
MSALWIGVFSLIGFLVIMFLGVPIPFAMCFAGAVGILAIQGPKITGQMLSAEFLSTFSTYAFTVSPMFGLMGFIASYSGVGANLYSAVNSFLGHKRGGLAMATQVACAGFGAICGSPPACISTFSAIAYPEMRKLNYAPQLAGTCISAGAALSVLIPPSSSLILYGIITDTSIGRLFMAGIVPGIVLCILNILAIVYIGKRHPSWAPTSTKYTWKERFQKMRSGSLLEILFVFILSMGGMFSGFFPHGGGRGRSFRHVYRNLAEQEAEF